MLPAVDNLGTNSIIIGHQLVPTYNTCSTPRNRKSDRYCRNVENNLPITDCTTQKNIKGFKYLKKTLISLCIVAETCCKNHK